MDLKNVRRLATTLGFLGGSHADALAALVDDPKPAVQVLGLIACRQSVMESHWGKDLTPDIVTQVQKRLPTMRKLPAENPSVDGLQRYADELQKLVGPATPELRAAAWAQFRADLNDRASRRPLPASPHPPQQPPAPTPADTEALIGQLSSPEYSAEMAGLSGLCRLYHPNADGNLRSLDERAADAAAHHTPPDLVPNGPLSLTAENRKALVAAVPKLIALIDKLQDAHLAPRLLGLVAADSPTARGELLSLAKNFGVVRTGVFNSEEVVDALVAAGPAVKPALAEMILHADAVGELQHHFLDAYRLPDPATQPHAATP